MINFGLCDDNIGILKKLEKMLESILIQNDLPGKIVLSTPHPQNVINYIENNQFYLPGSFDCFAVNLHYTTP